MNRRSGRAFTALACVLLAATAGAQVDPYPSTYHAKASGALLIRDATVVDGRGDLIESGSVLVANGKIAAVGRNIAVPVGARVISAAGKWVTPGIIDVHSHLGADAMPYVPALADGGEETAPITAGLRVEHSIWTQDPGFARARAGGVTVLHVLPGSTNLIGGHTVVLKNVPAHTVQEMKFPGAPLGIKMACGENPKRVYGALGRAPSTRMGSFGLYREAWIKARDYARRRNDAEPPPRDLTLEALAAVLAGETLVHVHCYRSDEMALMLDMAREFKYRVGTFHHASEAYKITDLLVRDNVCAAMWSDWWGLSMEMYDGIRENIAWLHAAGGCAVLHSDSALDAQRMNQEAAKALAAGRRAGLHLTKAEAWTWLSYNAARSLGIDDRTGSLEVGKMADLVLWDGDPFSVYTRAEQVFIDGAPVFDRSAPTVGPSSDFELGLIAAGERP